MRSRRPFELCALFLVNACGSASQPAANRVAAPEIAASPGRAGEERTPPELLAPPAGYVELAVQDVVATPHGGPAVLLRDAAGVHLVPIFVGGTEALSIELRHSRRRYVRPLTHDLLDAVLEKLGGSVIRVQIDGIKQDTFVGSVYVKRGRDVFKLDARPSDAIALALGSVAPIFVSPDVVEQAALEPGKPPPAAPEPGAPRWDL